VWWRGWGSSIIGLLGRSNRLKRRGCFIDAIGARAVLVHAKDDNAKGFYKHFNFEPAQSDPYHLMVIMKETCGELSAHNTVVEQLGHTPEFVDERSDVLV
jgi:hypothetical protein